MRKTIQVPLFGPGHWVTRSATGEHVKIESWSPIAASYRVYSRQNGLQFATEAELVEIGVHPQASLGRYWSRCLAPKCGAPLTPELAVCQQCGAPTCGCGRCKCARSVQAKARAKAARALASAAG